MARHDSKRKLKRNELLIAYQEAHPDESLREIGEVFGISAVRVFQILKREREKRRNDRAGAKPDTGTGEI